MTHNVQNRQRGRHKADVKAADVKTADVKAADVGQSGRWWVKEAQIITQP